jgi:hypothetical protein
MNEDDADQGRGLDTKYRIDSAQGESLFYIHLLPLYSPPRSDKGDNDINRDCSRTQAPSN